MTAERVKNKKRRKKTRKAAQMALSQKMRSHCETWWLLKKRNKNLVSENPWLHSKQDMKPRQELNVNSKKRRRSEKVTNYHQVRILFNYWWVLVFFFCRPKISIEEEVKTSSCQRGFRRQRVPSVGAART